MIKCNRTVQSAEVALIEKDFDQMRCEPYWRVVLWFNREPDLKMGRCEVKQ